VVFGLARGLARSGLAARGTAAGTRGPAGGCGAIVCRGGRRIVGGGQRFQRAARFRHRRVVDDHRALRLRVRLRAFDRALRGGQGLAQSSVAGEFAAGTGRGHARRPSKDDEEGDKDEAAQRKDPRQPPAPCRLHRRLGLAVFHVGEDPSRRLCGGGASCDQAGAIGSASIQVRSCSCPARAGGCPWPHSIGCRRGVNASRGGWRPLIVAWVVLAFALACVVAWLLLFPEAGDAFVALCRRIDCGGRGAGSGRGRDIVGRVGVAGRRVLAAVTSCAGGLFDHGWILLSAVLLMWVSSLLILWSRQRVVFESFRGPYMSRTRSM